MATKPRATARIARITPYRVPRHTAPIEVRLDGNEGPTPDGAVMARIEGDVAAILNGYPSPVTLQHRWATRLGVSPEHVRITAGADEAIDRIVRTFVGPGREMLAADPTFEMLERYCGLAGGRYVTVPWLEPLFPTEAFLRRVSPQTSLIAVVTPNNPTGFVASARAVAALSAAAPRAVVLVDLAYVEFADEDPTAAVLALPNVLVTRTLSKAWGLAGLRVGCVVGPTPLVSALAPAGNPYPVSGLSSAVAAAALAHEEEAMRAGVARVREQRRHLSGRLAELGASPGASEGNFVLARFADARWVWDALGSLGVAVRRFPDQSGLCDALRIACPGDERRFARLLRALEVALAPQALIFDLDGVIADVSASFRLAIVRTAEEYGVSVASGEVSRAKAAGGANNDWELTRRLLEAHGITRPLAEITRHFEAIYQGTAAVPGLWQSERSLARREWLRHLAACLPLAIVTGRPRRDAERFLEQEHLRDLFRVVVSMEDAPLKPDPAPVRLALARLGIDRAWMVGDTPDDIVAARAAGVVPIGIVAPGEDRSLVEPALLEAGAARVVRSLQEVEESLRVTRAGLGRIGRSTWEPINDRGCLPGGPAGGRRSTVMSPSR